MTLKKNRQSDIDDEGVQVFTDATKGWSRMKPEKDFGLDYVVEPFGKYDEGVATPDQVALLDGRSFIVQLKATEKAKDKADRFTFSDLKVELATYSLDKCRSPIFIVFVDATNKIGYWLFLQGFLLDEMSSQKWRNQKTMTIHIPKENVISNREKWVEGINSADQRMRQLCSTDPLVALKHEKEQLEKDNPGFKVTPSATLEGTVFQIEVDSDMHGVMRITGKPENVKAAMKDGIDFGKEIKAKEYEVRIEVDGFVKRRGSDNSISGFRAQSKTPASIVLTARTESGEMLGQLEMTGELVGGHNYRRIETALSSGVMHTSVEIHELRNIEDREFTGHITFNLDSWSGKDVRTLEDFGRMKDLFGRFVEGCQLSQRFCVIGNEVATKQLSDSDTKQFVFLSNSLKVLDIARDLSTKLGLELHVPSVVDDRAALELEFCNALRDGEHVLIGLDSFLFQRKMPVAEYNEMFDANGDVNPITLDIPSDEFEWTVWGKKVDLGPVVVRLANQGGFVVAHSESDSTNDQMMSVDFEHSDPMQLEMWAVEEKPRGDSPA